MASGVGYVGDKDIRPQPGLMENAFQTLHMVCEEGANELDINIDGVWALDS